MQSDDLNARLERLERSNRRWRLAAVAAACLGAGAILGGFRSQPTAGQPVAPGAGAAAPAAAPEDLRPKPIGTVISDDSSGRWGDTLLVIYDDGTIRSLNTRRQPRWEPFEFSPNAR